MQPTLQMPSATILPFPSSVRAAQRLSARDPWTLLEREAAGVCEAASGAWYHEAAIRRDERGN